ncbi:MAG TPA: hypothetical protein VLE97_08845 [Gaiellaceae bacterium]|nr:hypothetical protein [Gaiellaceae bacterium]
MTAEVFETFDRAALAALQARNVARVRAADYFTKKDDAGAEADAELARWDEYLSGFAKLEDGRCLCCGDRLGGHLLEKAMGLVGGVEWDLAHGEGHCSRCGYPMRGHHRIEGLGQISNLFLPYHPSTLSFPSAMEEP